VIHHPTFWATLLLSTVIGLLIVRARTTRPTGGSIADRTGEEILLPLEEIAGNIPETLARNFEEGVVLEQLLSKAQRKGILSARECELVRKFHCDGFQPEELRESKDGPSAIALYRRIQRAVHCLRRIGATDSPRSGTIPPSQDENIQRNFHQTWSISPRRCALGIVRRETHRSDPDWGRSLNPKFRRLRHDSGQRCETEK